MKKTRGQKSRATVPLNTAFLSKKQPKRRERFNKIKRQPEVQLQGKKTGQSSGGAFGDPWQSCQ
jgi:hypothetical protein